MSANVNSNSTTNTATFTVASSDSHSFVHDDDDGNLISDGRWDCVWDAENRLIQQTAAASDMPSTSSFFTSLTKWSEWTAFYAMQVSLREAKANLSRHKKPVVRIVPVVRQKHSRIGTLSRHPYRMGTPFDDPRQNAALADAFGDSNE